MLLPDVPTTPDGATVWIETVVVFPVDPGVNVEVPGDNASPLPPEMVTGVVIVPAVGLVLLRVTVSVWPPMSFCRLNQWLLLLGSRRAVFTVIV